MRPADDDFPLAIERRDDLREQLGTICSGWMVLELGCDLEVFARVISRSVPANF